MGNLLSTLVAGGVDYLAGSLTAMVWERIMHPYDPSKHKFISVLEGVFQFAATITTSDLISNVLTPAGANSTIGMVGVMFFALIYSPNMLAKLGAGHNTLKQILMFSIPPIPPSYSSPKPVQNPTSTLE